MDLIKKVINKKEKIDTGEVNASSVNAISISGDYIAVNNEYGHYEIGDNVGQTRNVIVNNHILVFKGGILVDILERE